MKVIEGHTLSGNVDRTCDVCIIGSGAGGSVAAARLAALGLDVVVLEAGGFYTQKDFVKPDERWSYPNLYQERGARSTSDGAITVLQGRAVGGGTLINWTTCFRTPDSILAHWRDHHGTALTTSMLTPHWDSVEKRLGIETWNAPNANNSVLRDGCEALGLPWMALRRNVRGCANTGLCGLGCPANAKQAMHLTYLADAVQSGATVYSETRVDTLEVENGRVARVIAFNQQRGQDRDGWYEVVIRPRVTLLCGGAINSPGVLLRSQLGGPNVGKRTFLHPVTAMLGRFAHRIAPFAGAPQSVSSHAFVHRNDGVGYFLEAAPMQPMLAASAPWTGGQALVDMMAQLEHLSGLIALHVDGLDERAPGGTVRLKPNGRPELDYPVGVDLADAFRHSQESMARIHFAAGAEEVMSTHSESVRMTSVDQLGRLSAASFGAQEHGIFSAHQMGGCSMGSDPSRHVVDLDLKVRGVDGLFVLDGSVLPTALGVNPSETIYGLAHLLAPLMASAV